MIDLERLESDPSYFKACCSAFYRSPLARLAFGESLHPGGFELTRDLATKMNLPRGSRVLDLASGNGATVAFLSDAFRWNVVGVDYDARPNGGTIAPGLSADAERLPLRAASMDGAVSECSMSLLPGGIAAVTELFRVVAPGGRIGISDMTLEDTATLSKTLRTALAAVACVATALPRDSYVHLLRTAGFESIEAVDRPDALRALLADLRGKVRLARTFLDVDSVEILGVRVRDVPDILEEADRLVREGSLSYGLWIAGRP